MTAMDLHGDFGEAGLGPHLLVHQPGRDQCHHLTLARAQAFEKGPHLGDQLRALATLSITFDRHRGSIKHILSRKGLVRKSTAPAFMALTVIGISPWPVMKITGM